jgi:apolipoprotein N-acyltransferase
VRALPLGVEGVLDSPLPRAIPPTIFARWGDRLFGALLICCGVAALIARRPRRPVRERWAAASI